jgi:hypothetical protein
MTPRDDSTLIAAFCFLGIAGVLVGMAVWQGLKEFF